MTDGAGEPSDTSVATSRRLAELIGGYQASAAIGAFARLGIADALAREPATSSELAASLGADEGILARLLEATLGIGLFTLAGDGCYRLTALGALLRTDVPGSLRRYAIVSTDEWRWYAYAHIIDTLRTGEPGFVAAHGCRFWDYLASHPDAAASFEETMARVGAARDEAILASVDFSGFRCVVDVGGGRGNLVSAVLAAHPHLHGVLFDLPSVVEGASQELRQVGLAERCEVVPGDFRQAVPPGGDAYLLAWILHDWDDLTARRILARCRAAMEPGARLFVVEMVIPEAGEPGTDAFGRLVRQADVEMLTVVGGRERTAKEFEALLTQSGFSVARIISLKGMPWSIIEGVASVETR